MTQLLTRYRKTLVLFLVGSLSLTACTAKQDAAAEEGPAKPALVSTLTVTSREITLIDELPARVYAFRTAEIRPQVGGIIQKRLFEEGSDVTEGQPLFQISTATFQAGVDSAQASFLKAQAGLRRAQTKLARSTALIKANSVSQQSHDDAIAEAAAAEADVALASAALNRAKLELAFATIKAPIAGRIGSARFNEGALANPLDAVPMATIQQIDKVYVDVRQPATRIDAIREAVQSGTLADASSLPVEILSTTGKPYSAKGRALFSDITVDPGTGSATVRVLVDNPGKALLPGMFVRARLPRGILAAVTVPQQAVIRDQAGRPQVIVLDAAMKGSARSVDLGEIVGGDYVVSAGLAAGETVVVEGQDRIQEGIALKAVAYQPVLSRNTF